MSRPWISDRRPVDRDSFPQESYDPEEKVRRAPEAKGPLPERDLRRYTHADRDGLRAFDSVRKNRFVASDTMRDGDKFRLGLG